MSLQIAQLFDLSRERDIKQRLARLPETLDQSYDEIYDQIKQQKGSTSEIAKRAFQWVMCSCVPLSPIELVAAVCQDPETDELDNVDIDIKIVLGACRNLLAVDQQRGACKFSHLSVQEYLETHHWTQNEANILISKVCLSLLNNAQ